MPFYTSEQILNQAFDQGTGTLKTSGPSGAAAATAANQTTTNDRLGTPGTGEPAHAGGSTGLIGWARDILAKIAAFGTSGVPSANVISVQGPPNQIGSITYGAINQALTLNCEGLGCAAFYCRSAGTASVRVELDFGNGVWQSAECAIHTANASAPIMFYGATSYSVNQWVVVNTRGADQVRLLCTAFTSAATFDGVVSPFPVLYAAEITQFGSATTLPTVTTVSTVSAVSQINGFATTAFGNFTTDTLTPLAAGATFTSSARSCLSGSIGSYTVQAISDQDSATNGLKLQRSTNASDWYDTWKSSVSANDPIEKRVWVTTAYTRVVYTNGATLQASFSLTSAVRAN